MVTGCPLLTPTPGRPLPFLVIEISDSTYAHDVGPKLRLYASAGVTDYWVLNLNERRLEVFRDPVRLADGTWNYLNVTHHAASEAVEPLNGPKVSIPVADMLPPAAEGVKPDRLAYGSVASAGSSSSMRNNASFSATVR